MRSRTPVSTHSITNGCGKGIFTLFGQFLFKIKLPHNLLPSIQVSNFKIISTILSVSHVELHRKWDNIILCNLRELAEILLTKKYVPGCDISQNYEGFILT